MLFTRFSSYMLIFVCEFLQEMSHEEYWIFHQTVPYSLLCYLTHWKYKDIGNTL